MRWRNEARPATCAPDAGWTKKRRGHSRRAYQQNRLATACWAFILSLPGDPASAPGSAVAEPPEQTLPEPFARRNDVRQSTIFDALKCGIFENKTNFTLKACVVVAARSGRRHHA
jgi:hypothetical protein